MCGIYVVKSKIRKIEKRFNLSESTIDSYLKYNTTPGDLAPVILHSEPKKLQLTMFGLRPSWAKKKMLRINARSEGDNNQENDPNYTGRKGIISKPVFRKPIRGQICLVIADTIVEGAVKEKLGKPYLVYLKDRVKESFAFAGIWDEWADPDTRGLIKSFAIIYYYG